MSLIVTMCPRASRSTAFSQNTNRWRHPVQCSDHLGIAASRKGRGASWHGIDIVFKWVAWLEGGFFLLHAHLKDAIFWRWMQQAQRLLAYFRTRTSGFSFFGIGLPAYFTQAARTISSANSGILPAGHPHAGHSRQRCVRGWNMSLLPGREQILIIVANGCSRLGRPQSSMNVRAWDRKAKRRCLQHPHRRAPERRSTYRSP